MKAFAFLRTRGDIFIETRITAFVAPFVLALAFLILYIFPDGDGAGAGFYSSAEDFAWPVRPQITAMILGATYGGGILYFSSLLFSRKWRSIGHGLIPVALFNWGMMLATITNWNDFTHDRAVFWVWSALYFTLPFVLPVLWYRNAKHSTSVPLTDHEVGVPHFVNGAYAVGGVGLILLAFTLFFFPVTMADKWPWEMSSLTARIMAAQVLLIGSYFLVLSRQSRWEVGRTYLRPFLLLPVLYGVAVLASWDDLETTNTSTWVYLIGASFLFLLYVPGIYIYMERKRKKAIGQSRWQIGQT